MSAEEAYDCARQCALNAIAAVKSQVELDSVVRVVKATVFVASCGDRLLSRLRPWIGTLRLPTRSR